MVLIYSMGEDCLGEVSKQMTGYGRLSGAPLSGAVSPDCRNLKPHHRSREGADHPPSPFKNTQKGGSWHAMHQKLTTSLSTSFFLL
jgi:hypothetical protein